MKSQEQVLRFISQNEFPDKEDWNSVLAWCKEHYGGGKAHKALRPISKCNFKQFQQWLDNGIAVGDIVKVGNILGIVGGYGYDQSFLSNIVLDSNIIVKKTWVNPSDVVLASNDEKQTIIDLMNQQHVKYSISLSRLVESYIPKDGEFVRIIQNKKTILGIYEKEDDGDYYCYGVISNRRFTGMRIFPANGSSIEKATKIDIERIKKTLATSGLEWNAESKKIVSAAHIRSRKGGYFWYVSERFMPESDKDTYSQLCNEKFECGNYFHSYKECFDFCMQIKNLRRKK